MKIDNPGELSQKELRFLYVDAGVRMLYNDEGIPTHQIRTDAQIKQPHPDRHWLWLKQVLEEE